VKISVGCDHGGIELKNIIIPFLTNLDCQVIDCGCKDSESVDYPDYAQKVCDSIKQGDVARGILICGTGIGMSMAANRYPEIRAALCHELFTARMSREHNDSNVLCLGARVIGPGLAAEIVRVWVETEFAGGRHLNRITMF
jgi:ribose 5-phosphate isomerase B